MYHAISNQARARFARWAVSPELFDAHLSYLKDAGYHSHTVSELVSLLRHGNFNPLFKHVVITLDDGFADCYHNALPVLQKHAMKATVYIPTQYVGGCSQWLEPLEEGDRPLMHWDQIRELCSAGIEIGAHSHSHPQLDILPAAEAEQEIWQSRQILEDQLNRPILSFAYPQGYYNQYVKAMVGQAGFTSACAVKHALSSPEDDLFALARLIVSAETSLDDLKVMVEGKNMPVAPYPERVQTKAWRSMRRLFAQMNLRPWL
jgi:peptidoglycan/xylan/chitin deacetylase (PgdA/CDA1 family)